jgi:hypothetical protein
MPDLPDYYTIEVLQHGKPHDHTHLSPRYDSEAEALEIKSQLRPNPAADPSDIVDVPWLTIPRREIASVKVTPGFNPSFY